MRPSSVSARSIRRSRTVRIWRKRFCRVPPTSSPRYSKPHDTKDLSLPFRLALVGALFSIAAPTRPPVEVLHPSDGIPGHLMSTFHEATSFVETTDGTALVLDAGTHTVFAIDKARTTAKAIVTIGPENGRLLVPRSLSLSRDDLMAVADAPSNVDRIQYFSPAGTRVGGFYLPDRLAGPRM